MSRSLCRASPRLELHAGGSGSSAVRTLDDDGEFDPLEGGVRAGIVDGDEHADEINFHHSTKFKVVRVWSTACGDGLMCTLDT